MGMLGTNTRFHEAAASPLLITTRVGGYGPAWSTLNARYLRANVVAIASTGAPSASPTLVPPREQPAAAEPERTAQMAHVSVAGIRLMLSAVVALVRGVRADAADGVLLHAPPPPWRPPPWRPPPKRTADLGDSSANGETELSVQPSCNAEASAIARSATRDMDETRETVEVHVCQTDIRDLPIFNGIVVLRATSRLLGSPGRAFARKRRRVCTEIVSLI